MTVNSLPSNTELIDRFVENYKITRRSPALSHRYVRNDLLKFAEFCGPLSFFDFKSLNAQDYLFLLSKQKMAAATIRRKISHSSSLFKFMGKVYDFGRQPFAGLDLPHINRQGSFYLTPDYVQRIYSFLKEEISTTRTRSGEGSPRHLNAVRNFAVVVTMLYTGFRRAEICSLTLHSISRRDGDLVFSVVGKGNKQRSIAVSDVCYNLVMQYLQLRKQHLPSFRSAHLFINHLTGKPITASFVRYLVSDINKSAGLPGRLTPHKFRHTFATQLLARKEDLLTIRDLLGHADISTTQIYAHSADKTKIRAVKELSYGTI